MLDTAELLDDVQLGWCILGLFTTFRGLANRSITAVSSWTYPAGMQFSCVLNIGGSVV